MRKLEIIASSMLLFGLSMLLILITFHATILGFVVLFSWGVLIVSAIVAVIILVVLGSGGVLTVSWGFERLCQQKEVTRQARLQNMREQLELHHTELQMWIEFQKSLEVMQVLKSGESLVSNQPNLTLMTGPTPIVKSNNVNVPTTAIQGHDNQARAYVKDSNWINKFLFDEQNRLKQFHIKMDGPTGVGKTRLMLHIIWLLQQPHPAAEYWLCDPKFEGKSSGWPFEPFVTDFDNVATGAQYLYDKVVTARKLAKRTGSDPKHPAFLIFDEADGCFEEHGKEFTKPLKRIIKEGRSGLTYCFLAGQSPLAKDVGLSGSLFRNMARFVFGTEALAFLRNIQFSYWAKSDRALWSKQLQYLQEKSIRSCLAIPASGKGPPFVAAIPYLSKPEFINLADCNPPKNHLKPKQNGHKKKPDSSNKVSDQQLLADIETVMQNRHKIRYRKEKAVRASICEALGIHYGGREYPRAKAVADYMEAKKLEDQPKL
ncbi:hypothetical protein QUF58_01785 [Anaerolineales bacterium HSG24]|nr:hypothetical protein [Anaerolineales bacterium HSG24]